MPPARPANELLDNPCVTPVPSGSMPIHPLRESLIFPLVDLVLERLWAWFEVYCSMFRENQSVQGISRVHEVGSDLLGGWCTAAEVKMTIEFAIRLNTSG